MEGNEKLIQEIAELVKVHTRQLEIHERELVELKAQTKQMREERAEDRRRWQRIFQGHEKFMRYLDKRLDLHYRLFRRQG